MKHTLITKCYDRELGSLAVRTQAHRKLYGEPQLISRLDIVNELDGHSGCVNALSWSKSGQFLASGSDDQHLNIYRYQPEALSTQFQLTTTVATGHSQNIFSVKFMPHHNDRTVVTCAGDHQVRVFDLEYAGAARAASNASVMASQGRTSRRANAYNGVRYLSDGDTDCRVYRSHGDRVKRIVTESSPHLFLTCAEDGEVRQWDLRQPSTTYPAPRFGRYDRQISAVDDDVPAPLISYKRYRIDLNTISCSPAQPHYIVLGGSHLHAFLHDRRMAGRDRLQEAGRHLPPPGTMSADEEALMDEATRCVRKFAPRGQDQMSRSENGHITACKISDARPNEMIASWSGDHIYSFALNGGPEGPGQDQFALKGNGDGRARESRDRKRKRATNGSDASIANSDKHISRPKTELAVPVAEGAALRIRYQNGQSEEIPFPSRDMPQDLPDRVYITAKEREAQRLATKIGRMRAALSRPPRFNTVLYCAFSVLDDIDETMRRWSYPLNPSDETVVLQQSLRRNRESTRRFVQAAGCVSRVLGARLRTSSNHSLTMARFTGIEVRTNDLPAARLEQFGYDFLKAILLWLESGVGWLIEGFTRPAEMLLTSRPAQRLPISESEASVESIEEFLIPYLLNLASDRPLINVESNRFETDASRQLFVSEKAAVLAFAAAIRIPFADLSSAVAFADGTDQIGAQDRQTAIRYWGHKVARSVLLHAAKNLDSALVTRAFGGSLEQTRRIEVDESHMDYVSDAEDDPIEYLEVLGEDGRATDGANAEDIRRNLRSMSEDSVIGTGREGDAETESDGENDGEEENAAGNLTGSEDETDEHDSDDSRHDRNGDDNNDETETDHDIFLRSGMLPLQMFANDRRQERDKVGIGVPCTAATRTYKGHCNVRTVKDVNYFGLDDEYVVSGSDDGNLFIWDRKTSELVNVLEGDGEVVNVVQGHPYETMLAVSGIDHTIKIFSPDARAREKARLGRGVHAHDSSTFSSLAWPMRLGRRAHGRNHETDSTAGVSESAVPQPACMEAEDENAVAPTGLPSRRRLDQAYQITNRNDMDRRGGNQDRFITVRDLHPLLMLIGQANW